MSTFAKFCTSCGASLEDGQKFCTSCGAPVLTANNISENQLTQQVSSGATQVLSSNPGDTSPMPVVGGDVRNPDSWDVTRAFSVADVRNRQYRQNPSLTASAAVGNADSKKKFLIGVVVVLAVLVCVLIGFLFGAMGSNQPSSDSSNTGSNQPAVSDDPVANTSSDTSKNESAAGDKELYTQLSNFYTRLESYDGKISSEAKNFNANYMSKSMSTRSSCAGEASSLQADIADDYAALKELSVPSGSQYSSCYSAMLTCYYDCTQRIGVIVEAWNNSLEYSDPTGHSDEICEPLSRDKSGDSNKYYTEFNQTFPSAKPSSPK